MRARRVFPECNANQNRCGTSLGRNYFSATYQNKHKNWIETYLYCGIIDDLEEPSGWKDLVRRARKVCPECKDATVVEMDPAMMAIKCAILDESIKKREAVVKEIGIKNVQ